MIMPKDRLAKGVTEDYKNYKGRSFWIAPVLFKMSNVNIVQIVLYSKRSLDCIVLHYRSIWHNFVSEGDQRVQESMIIWRRCWHIF